MAEFDPILTEAEIDFLQDQRILPKTHLQHQLELIHNLNQEWF